MNRSDRVVLKKIIKYADQMQLSVDEISQSYDKFLGSSTARNAVAMCILQIGELANKLTKEFRITYNGMPWNFIVNMRHRMAHDYDESDIEIIWNTAIEDVPGLKDYCQKVLDEAGEE